MRACTSTMKVLDTDTDPSPPCSTMPRTVDTTALDDTNNDVRPTPTCQVVSDESKNKKNSACSTSNRVADMSSALSVEDTQSPRWALWFSASPKHEPGSGGGSGNSGGGGGGLLRWKRQLQRAWKWGPNSKSQGSRSSFNPEILANQKRQWYQIHSQSPNHNHYKEPTSLFEHFVVVGLHSNANFEATEDAFAKRKMWESEVSKSEIVDLIKYPHRSTPVPILEPQVLFKFPPGKKLIMQTKDLPAFCFPGGVKARIMERTPSMSDLNEILYGQEHLSRDDFSFIFSVKVAGNATLYGVCMHVQEIVQRAPGILGAVSPLSQTSGRSRFLVSSPRCYCLLTRVPFFELHYEMLNSILAQERLDRISQFVNEMSLIDYIPPMIRMREQIDSNSDSLNGENTSDWMSYAIPIDSVLGLTAAAAGMVSNNEVCSLSFRTSEPPTPESISASEGSDLCQSRDRDRKCALSCDGYASEVYESLSDSFDRSNDSCENGHVSPEAGLPNSVSRPIERIASSESLLSSVRSVGSEGDDTDEVISFYNAGEEVMEWVKASKNDLLRIVCGYYSLQLPARGTEIIFQPLEHLQPVKYFRPDVSALDLDARYSLFGSTCSSLEVAKLNAKLSAAEEALSLSVWATATVCRALSLESVGKWLMYGIPLMHACCESNSFDFLVPEFQVLALITGALLEKQVVVVCSNLGVLSASVLSTIPMIRPFEWQSLLLPVLPRKMLDFLDAPVPFIVGIQQKPAELKMKSANIICVNVHKNQVKMGSLPSLPRHRELISELRPIHARLASESNVAKRHPVYKCSEVQAEAATEFLNVMRRYLESLCSNLRDYAITSVESNNDRVSLLLKDSFIESFPARDKPFIKHFVDTQLFTVLSDSRLSSHESLQP